MNVLTSAADEQKVGASATGSGGCSGWGRGTSEFESGLPVLMYSTQQEISGLLFCGV